MPLRCFASLCLIVILGCGGGAASAPSAPTLMTQPQSAMLEVNSAVRLEVQAFGTPSPSYQWRKNGVDLPGEVRPELVRSPLTSADEGDYSVVVSNAKGTVVSATATLHVVDHLHWVTQSGDSGAGSLREALETSNAAWMSTHGILFRYPPGPWEIPDSNGQISFPTAPVLQILLASPLPPIRCSVRIQGFDPGQVIIDGANQHRPFLVQSGQVVLQRLVIAHGLAKGGDSWGGGGGAGMGGGLFVDGGDVQLEDVVFYRNRAVGGSSFPAATGTRGGGAGSVLDAPVGGSGADGAPFCGHGGAGNLAAPTSANVFGQDAQTSVGCLGVFAGGGAASGSDGTGSTANWGGKGGFGAGGGFAMAPGIGGDGGGLSGEFFGGGGGGVYNPSMNPVAAGGEGGLWGGSGDESGRGGGGAGLGGAIFLRQGQISVLKRCQFRNNEAVAGAGAPNPTSAATAKAKGGAIYIYPKPYPFTVNGVSPSLDACSSGGPLDTVFPLSELLAQRYEGNVAADATAGVVDDSADFYRARCAQVPIIVRERQVWKARVKAQIQANARHSEKR